MENKMKKQNVINSLFDISNFSIKYEDNNWIIEEVELFEKIARQVSRGTGYAFCYGVNKLFEKNNLEFEKKEHVATAYQLLENLFQKSMQELNIQDFSVVNAAYDHIGAMDVDGFNLNKGHTPNEHTEPRDFVTTKCLHFDGATPFIANIYGPNTNIYGGFPVIADTALFCRENNISPRCLVQNIPENYNVVIKEDYYYEILANYTAALLFDMRDDMIMSILFNEVSGGVAHGATRPQKIDINKVASRPIRHIEFQFSNPKNYKDWYEYYNLRLDKANNVEDEGKKLIIDYYSKTPKPIENIINVSDLGK